MPSPEPLSANQVVGGKARLIGAALRALAGGTVGNYQEKQQMALEEVLRVERQQKQVASERLQNDVLRLSLRDEASFGFDSAELKPAFRPTLDKLANEMSTFDKTVLHVVGYTDDIGTETTIWDCRRNVQMWLRNTWKTMVLPGDIGGVVRQEMAQVHMSQCCNRPCQRQSSTTGNGYILGTVLRWHAPTI